MKRLGPILLLLVCTQRQSCRAEESPNHMLIPAATGARIGFWAEGRNDGFIQTDVFADWRLPCGWDGEDGLQGWYCEWWLEGVVGTLFRGGDVAVVGTLGPILKGGYRDFPVYVELGCSPTLLSRHELDGQDFGGTFQFTSHFGLGVELGSHWELEYRLQHMSNFGLYTPNFGMNLHGFSVRYRF
jgi:hypothetical protein